MKHVLCYFKRKFWEQGRKGRAEENGEAEGEEKEEKGVRRKRIRRKMWMERR
jgi:hypothetical protein